MTVEEAIRRMAEGGWDPSGDMPEWAIAEGFVVETQEAPCECHNRIRVVYHAESPWDQRQVHAW